MRKKGQKTTKSKIQNYQICNIPENKLVEIQTEAYYRALKRLEEEKKEEENNDAIQGEKENFFMKILFILNICFFPFRINKHFQLREQIYDSIPQFFVCFILRTSGFLMWVVGLAYPFFVIRSGNIEGNFQSYLYHLFVDLFIFLFGSLFYLSGNAFNKETDSNRIYAYSASIFALISCIISLVAIIIH